MSGRYWGANTPFRVKDGLHTVSKGIQEELPMLSELLQKLGYNLYEVLCELDFHFSADTTIPDLVKFEKDAIRKLTTK